ncbi:MAG: hypothetical protein CTY12_00150 [Methylotenera sp.]|nr:MAG: hypothetical protein CTY12_00150 [Methylotenera sp.]
MTGLVIGTIQRTLTAASSKLTITNPDGVIGDPTFDVDETNININNLYGTLSITKGGTGQTTAISAFGALSPLSTKGDILTFGTTNTRLPVGTTGQILTVDPTQSTGLKWVTPTLSQPTYAKLTYTVAYTSGPINITTSKTSWNTTPLNTEEQDPSGIASLTSNQFTLSAGTYYLNGDITWTTVANNGNPPNPARLQFRLYNVTDSTVVSNAFESSGQTNSASTYTVFTGRIQGFVAISDTKTFRIEHIVNGNTGDSYQLGYDSWSIQAAQGSKDFVSLAILKLS